jgi:hypothetical protein
MDIDCVLCEVLTEFLYIRVIYANICLQSVNGFHFFKTLINPIKFCDIPAFKVNNFRPCHRRDYLMKTAVTGCERNRSQYLKIHLYYQFFPRHEESNNELTRRQTLTYICLASLGAICLPVTNNSQTCLLLTGRN